MINREIKSAVVTGATGTIGSALCRYLIKKQIIVFAVVRPKSKRLNQLKKDPLLNIIECDLDHLEYLINRIDQTIDVFYHFAWAGTTGDERNNTSLQLDNIKFSVEAVNVAHALGAQVYIGAGSQAEYGTPNVKLSEATPCFPRNSYGIAKLCAGQLTRQQANFLHMDHIWPRILSVYGPGCASNSMLVELIKKLRNKEHIAMTEATQIWDYMYSDDAAEAMYLLALHGRNNKVYPIGSGIGKPLKTYVELVKKTIDKEANIGYGEVPNTAHINYLVADINDLTDDTGFIPKTPFEIGIKTMIDLEEM